MSGVIPVVPGAPVRTRKPRVKTKAVADTAEVIKIEEGFVTINGYFKVDIGVYKILESNIKKCRHTMLLGSTGVGKTELVCNVAKALGLEVTTFDMGTMTDPIMSLVGTHVIQAQDGHTTSRFVRSRFSEVIQKPGVVLLDEISR